MELKSNRAIFSCSTLVGSNRTFMELKYNKFTKPSEDKKVLIVPLWN